MSTTSEATMTRTTRTLFIVAAAVLAACERSTLTNPRYEMSATFDRAANGPVCSITLPAPAHRPLPGVREVARELNEAFTRDGTSCGIVNGFDERFNTLVSKLDLADADQNLDAACGIAGSLVNQLEELVKHGLNPIVSHDPQASPNVLENMNFIRSQFCENAGR
jgi:hypothetical protein